MASRGRGRGRRRVDSGSEVRLEDEDEDYNLLNDNVDHTPERPPMASRPRRTAPPNETCLVTNKKFADIAENGKRFALAGPGPAIGRIIRGNYSYPMYCWSQLKDHEDWRTNMVELWFIKFANEWRPRPGVSEYDFKKAWTGHAMDLLRDMMGDARSNASKRMEERRLSSYADIAEHEKPKWINPDLWKELAKEWDTQAYKEKGAQAAKNRNQGGITKHTAGALPFKTVEAILGTEKGRIPMTSELYAETHMTKDPSKAVDTEGFVDERSK